jgi:hypothetical protein
MSDTSGHPGHVFVDQNLDPPSPWPQVAHSPQLLYSPIVYTLTLLSASSNVTESDCHAIEDFHLYPFQFLPSKSLLLRASSLKNKYFLVNRLSLLHELDSDLDAPLFSIDSTSIVKSIHVYILLRVRSVLLVSNYGMVLLCL